MIQPIVFLFVLLSGAFAIVHTGATLSSLYWYYWWFDIVMHFWGGILITLGVHSFCTFSRIHAKPHVPLVLTTLLIAMVTWEIFEFWAGLYTPATYVWDTGKDLLVGISGGLLAQVALRNYTIG